MSWTRPTLAQLHSRIAGDFSARLLDGGVILSRSVLAVLAKIWAGACHGLHGFFAWLFLQVFVDTAEDEYLRRWAAVWNIERKPAAQAAGAVRFTGHDGAAIPAGTLCINNGTQQQYALAADAAVSSGQATATVYAVEPGAAGNLDAGAELALVAPVAGVEPTALVLDDGDGAGLSGGVDAETDASLRARLLARLRNPPRGGSAADYVQWALSVAGVTRAWCYPLMGGIGTVGLCFVTDDAATGPIPTQEMVERVAAYIETVRPATVEGIDVFGPEPLENVVRLKITPDTEAMRAAVMGELADLWQREGEPGAVIYRSHIAEAVSLTAGEVDNVIIFPAADISVPDGVLPMLAAVEFVDGAGAVTRYPVGA